jgi:hypothetical protein
MTDLTTILADDITVPYPALLDALHERCGAGRLTASPGKYVLASPARLPGTADGPLRRLELALAVAEPMPSAEAPSRAPQSGPAGNDRQHGEPASGPGAADRFAAGLLALHRELLRRTLRHAMSHLEGRTSDGTSLLSRQLIQGQLADVAMALSAEETMPAARGDADAARWRSHQRMVAAGRELVRLLGASGFLTDSPAADLYLAEVAGNVYLHPGGPDD